MGNNGPFGMRRDEQGGVMENESRADFVVVGGGSAGCIVAARLAERGFDTILIEEGPRDTHPLIHVPAGVRHLLNNGSIARQEQTEPGDHAAGRSIMWPRGRVLGASGSINGMIYARGSRQDFRQWGQAGAIGWDYDDVLPHFISMENYLGRGLGRGTDGPLSVEGPRFRLPITDDFVEAATNAGHRLLDDVNGPENEGVGLAQMNRRGRFRHSSARAFLKPALRTGRLRVVTEARADRLTLDGRRCTGVEVRMGGTLRRYAACREVVVCAGALGSPQLLQRSGIGPGAVLAKLGVPVVHDLSGVGRNLMDHYGARLAFRVRGRRTVNELAHFPRVAIEAVRWLSTGGGALTTGVTSAMVFCRSAERDGRPDLQLLFSPMSFNANRYGELEREPGVSISVCLSSPDSRGQVMISGPEPDAPLRIQPNYLSAGRDLERIVAGMGKARAMCRTELERPVVFIGCCSSAQYGLILSQKGPCPHP
jgi:choline dehydrogenase